MPGENSYSSADSDCPPLFDTPDECITFANACPSRQLLRLHGPSKAEQRAFKTFHQKCIVTEGKDLRWYVPAPSDRAELNEEQYSLWLAGERMYTSFFCK